MQQLLTDTTFAARKRFPGRPIRVWYVMINKRAWRAIIINTASKVKLAEGPVRASCKAALLACKNQLEAALLKTS